MTSNSTPIEAARALERRLRTALTSLSLAAPAGVQAELDRLDATLGEFESLLLRSRDALPWPPDAEARLSISRLEVRRLREGKSQRTEAVARMRLLLPRFPNADGPEPRGESG